MHGQPALRAFGSGPVTSKCAGALPDALGPNASSSLKIKSRNDSRASIRVRLYQVEHIVAPDKNGSYFHPFVETVRAIAIRIGPHAGNAVGRDAGRPEKGRVGVAVRHGRDDRNARPISGGE